MAGLKAIAAALALMLLGATAQAQETLPQLPPRAAPTVAVERGALAPISVSLDVPRAVAGYLSRVTGTARARSDAYSEGGYWLQLLDLAYGLAIAGVLLGFGISTRMRDWTAERTHSRTGQVVLYAVGYTTIVTALSLPLALYEEFFREQAYGLSNQDFGGWMGDWAISFALTLGAGVVLLPILYFVIRQAREFWWVWGAGMAVLTLVFFYAIAPVFVAPLFNRYTPLPDSPLKQQIMSLARAHQIPATDIYVMDASRQTSRISANVSGFLGTTRISLNDNLLRQGTQDEVLAVMGHEMAHYALGHTTRLLLLTGLVIVLGFGFVAFTFGIATEFFGGMWQVRRIEDVAGMPLLTALFSIWFFVMTPVTNTISRTTEAQADIFGLDAVRKPDAFATVMLKLSTYRKLDPGHWEEVIFFDHPSGRSRIETAMRWKAEHVSDPDILGGPASPQ